MATSNERLEEKEFERLQKLMAYETKAYQNGYEIVAGIDEAGRGPLAGPVVAAVCILPRSRLISRINDSKKLSPKLRDEIFQEFTNDPEIQYGIGIVDSEEIDRINIYQATIQAMLLAVEQLKIQPDYLLVDGLNLMHKTIPSEKIIKGDQLSGSIAAASIIAKETRDRLMVHYHDKWPEYHFNQHKGYGTEIHRRALQKYGFCPIHRRSFKNKELTGI